MRRPELEKEPSSVLYWGNPFGLSVGPLSYGTVKQAGSPGKAHTVCIAFREVSRGGTVHTWLCLQYWIGVQTLATQLKQQGRGWTFCLWAAVEGTLVES